MTDRPFYPASMIERIRQLAWRAGFVEGGLLGFVLGAVLMLFTRGA